MFTRLALPSPPAGQPVQPRLPLLLAGVTAGAVASVLTSAAVNLAVPDLSHEFGVGPAQAQWVWSGYMLAMTSSMLATPWLLRRVGCRTVYAAALGLLLAGAGVCALSTGFGMLLAGRVLQGLAAGVLQPLPAVLVLRHMAIERRGRATGLVAMGVMLAVALGTAMGGALMAVAGWRAVFALPLPFAALAWPLLRASLPDETRAPSTKGAPLDWPGLLLCNLAALCLVSALTQACAVAGSAWQAWALLTLAAIAAAGFVHRQHSLARRTVPGGPAPLVDLTVLADRNLARGCVAAGLYGVALQGSSYLLPLYLRQGLGLAAGQAGWMLMAAGLATVAAAPLAGRWLDRAPQWPLASLGFALLATALVQLVPARDGGAAALVATAALGRAGLGLVLPAVTLHALRTLAPAQVPLGSALCNFTQFLGGALSVGLCGTVLAVRLAACGDGPVAAPVGALAGLDPAMATLAAFEHCFLLLAGLCALAALAAWPMRRATANAQA